MKTSTIKTFALGTTLLAAAFTGSANAHHGGQNHQHNATFFGNWVSVNPNTSGITRMKIKNRLHRGKIVVKTWGQCHPQDCAWGRTKGTLYKKRNQQQFVGKKKLVAQYSTSFKETTLIMTKIAPNRMKVQNFTRFTDNSGRAPYFSNSVLKRGAHAIAPRPVPRFQDVAVTNVRHWWNANRGRYIVEATVKNRGNKAAGITQVNLERSRTGRPVVFNSGKKTIQQLNPGQQRVVRLSLPFRPVLSGRLQVHAKGSNGRDRNLSNNKRKITF